MAGKDEAEPIALTPAEWRRLHDKVFADSIYERVRNTLLVVVGIAGAVGIGALLGPVRTSIVADASEKAIQQLRGDAVAQSRQALNDEAAAAAREAANREVNALLEARAGPLRAALTRTTEEILRDGLIRDTLAAIVEGNFENRAAATDQRTLSFRLLLSLGGVPRADAALLKALQQRLAPSAEATAEQLAAEDQVLAAALAARADRPADPSAADRERFRFTPERRALAEAAFALLDRTRDPASDASNALADATARLVGNMEPAEEVARWLGGLAGGARPIPGRHSAAWELLLKDRRAPALSRLAGQLDAGSPAEIASVLAALAPFDWPRLAPAEAAFLLARIEQQAPDSLLGWRELTPAALEGRLALLHAGALGPRAVQQALAVWRRGVEEGAPPAWRPLIEAYGRAAEARPAQRAVDPMAQPAALPALPLGPEPGAPDWALLLRRALHSVGEAGEAELLARLLAPLPPDSSPDARQQRDRRLALLAFALAAPRPQIPEPAAALRLAVLGALAARPELERAPALGVAFQRMLLVARPEECAAVRLPMARGAWPAVALAACAGSLGALAAELDAAPDQAARDRLLTLWALVARRGDGFEGGGAPAERRARLLAAALEGRPAEAQGLALLRAVRRGLADAPARFELDMALARAQLLGLSALAAGAAAGEVPDWVRAAWWEGSARWDAASGDALRVPDDGVARVEVACVPDRRVRLRLEGEAERGVSVGVVALDAAGTARLVALRRHERGAYAEAALAVPMGCEGPSRLAVFAAPGWTLTLAGEAPAAAARGAESFAALAGAPQLEPGRALRIELAPQAEAYFRVAAPPGGFLALRTRNLADATDTILAVLDERGETLAENDDGNPEERYASLIEVPSGAVAVRASTFNGAGGAFDLVLEAAEATALPPGAPQAALLPRNARLVYRAELESGRRYVLTTRDLEARVDTVLRVNGPGGLRLTDDDGGGGLASRLVVVPRQSGPHSVVLTNIGQPGRAVLLLEEER
jgi:hypothetical protein